LGPGDIPFELAAWFFKVRSPNENYFRWRALNARLKLSVKRNRAPMASQSAALTQLCVWKAAGVAIPKKRMKIAIPSVRIRFTAPPVYETNSSRGGEPQPEFAIPWIVGASYSFRPM